MSEFNNTNTNTNSNDNDNDDDCKEQQIFLHPETGEQISKNAYKKLMKGGPPKKEKKEKPIPVPKSDNSTKKEKKVKDPEQVFIDETPDGNKKIIDGIFPPTYQPKYVEAAWQSWWEKSKFYSPNRDDALNRPYEEKFIMVIPPPNVTGSLHLGHALTTAVEDCLTRWHRMNGKIALWVPGTDHAGIATQSVVEKRLKKEQNVTRHDLGREEFVRRVWEWKNIYGNKITTQIRCLGASVDWSREAFTMDANLSRAVVEAFCKFYEDGLIYRDTRLINWSCALQSAISEIEVEYLDIAGKTFLPVPNHGKKDYEFGTITSFAYKVDGSDTDEEIIVATTRLETMLGDTAVAVHPDDPRYKHLHGKFVKHPFVDRKIPIITDSVLVDMNFGTGAVKITPAHDPNDYLCGKRQNLEFIIVLTEDGKIASNGGTFAGMMRYDARIAMENELKTLNLYRGKEPNPMRLGICSRSGDIIEPMLTPQWYVNCTSMAERSVAAVRNGDLQIIPSEHEATWYRWLENIRDWCISRQLWWGHRIPAYFARVKGEDSLDKNDPANSKRWFVARSEAEALNEAAKAIGTSKENITLEQDEDVLDTWFSSGLFPFSVFGWPNNTEDMKAFYPTTLLETGLDILFFWVARMVMMGLHLTDTLPFTKVYLHAMVRDKNGRKMSKSLGNVIDPLEVINGCKLEDLFKKIDDGNLPAKEVAKAKESQKEDFPDGIPECGADALRFGLLAYTSQGRDVNLDIKRVVGYRQFCNKLWNAVRFALTYVDNFVPSENMLDAVLASPHISKRDQFILSRLNNTIIEVTKELNGYQFGAAVSVLHSFFLYDVCDLYLELIKPIMYDDSEQNKNKKSCAQITLYTVIEQFLRLCHPFMPFVTEELWQRLPNRLSLCKSESIMIASYPKPVNNMTNTIAEKDMEMIKELIHGARSLRVDYKIANNAKADYYFKADMKDIQDIVHNQSDDFCTLAKANVLKFLPSDGDIPKGCCLKILSEHLSLLIDVTGLIDIDQELIRLSKDKERLLPSIDQYKKKIASHNEKIPENVQQQNNEKLVSLEAEYAAIVEAIASFEKMKLN